MMNDAQQIFTDNLKSTSLSINQLNETFHWTPAYQKVCTNVTNLFQLFANIYNMSYAYRP